MRQILRNLHPVLTTAVMAMATASAMNSASSAQAQTSSACIYSEESEEVECGDLLIFYSRGTEGPIDCVSPEDCPGIERERLQDALKQALERLEHTGED